MGRNASSSIGKKPQVRSSFVVKALERLGIAVPAGKTRNSFLPVLYSDLRQ